MIVISDDLVLAAPPGVDLNAPVIGWRNSLTAGNVSSEAALVDAPVTNLANPSTYLKWKSGSLSMQHVKVELGAPTPINYLAIAGHNFGTGQIAAAVEGALTTDTQQKVLLHFNGADAATTIVDSNVGGSAHAWTAAGNAQLDTAQVKFGASSALFDGTGDWFDTPDSVDFTLGSGNFTIDFWFNCVAAGGADKRLAGQLDSAFTDANIAWFMFRTSANVVQAVVKWNGASQTVVTGTTQFTSVLNLGWHHCALVRVGNVLKLFVDGVQEGGDQAITGTVNDSPNKLAVGRGGEATGSEWQGWIDEFRMLVGRAAWTANFNPEDVEYDQWNWQLFGDEQLPADDQPIIWRFAQQTLMAVRLRMTPNASTSPEISVMYADVLLQLQRRIYVGHRVINYNRRANVVTGYSDEANFLGRLVLGELNETALSLQNITASFYRTDVDPWLKNSVQKPFFFAWRPQGYPLEVGFCWLTGDAQMSNQRANGMVQVSAGLRGVVS